MKKLGWLFDLWTVSLFKCEPNLLSLNALTFDQLLKDFSPILLSIQIIKSQTGPISPPFRFSHLLRKVLYEGETEKKKKWKNRKNKGKHEP